MTIPKPVKRARAQWREVVARFEHPSHGRSIGQIASTILPYLALLVVMYFSLGISYWLTLALAFPAAAFLIRSFMIFHDCGHGSFFKSRRANRITGFFTGLLAFTPSYYWSHEHAKHHAHAGDLDHRGAGDIWTLTVDEYLAQPRWRRIQYRLYRHPLVMFGVGPLYTFLIKYRFWMPRDTSRSAWSTMRTNIAIVAIVVATSLTIGIKAYLMIYMPVITIGATAGVWLFYVQHQFEDVYWDRHDNWSYEREAIEGCSFYRLPRILQWFTGSIGFHHVHHLSPRIPNYNLERCHKSHTMFQRVKQITILTSLKSLTFRLWDEERKKLVGYNYIKVFLAKQTAATQ